MTKEYSCGFIFDLSATRVLLLKKRPGAPNAGFWNGHGGKIEPNGESPLDCIIRETKEEVGLNITTWDEFCELRGPGFVVHFFRTFTNKIGQAAQQEVEEIEIYNVKLLPNVVPNVKFLIPMALSIDLDSASKFVIQEII